MSRLSPLLLTLALSAAASPAIGRTLRGDEVAVYENSGVGQPLYLPTAVAAGPSGVWVADGVHDRVLLFDDGGEVAGILLRVDGKRLSRPAALDLSADGRLWIADTGNQRVVTMNTSGGGEATIEIPAELRSHGLDLTGIAVSSDNSTLWLVDNDRHRLLKADLAAGTWEAQGGQGEAWDQLYYPFMVTAGPDGQSYVSDALNGRVQVFTAEGRPRQPIGSYGVSPGQLYRPKGLAVANGRLWVADGVLGVVQAFGLNGAFLDVLREPNGEVLRLDVPTGLDAWGDRLFVVELGASRVRAFRISEGDGAAFTAVTAQVAGSAAAAKGKECTSCHLELMPALDEGVGDPLIPPPPDTDEQPWVSREESCLSCHDGTIMDSRREVWEMHGHPVGEEPPQDMQIPPELPLVHGKLACRTCHSAHTMGGSGQSHTDVLLLRVTDKASELCVACHGTMEGDQR